MLAALSEWFSGELEPYVGDISLFFGKWKELVDSFTAEIQPMAEKQLLTWMDYINRLGKTTAGPWCRQGLVGSNLVPSTARPSLLFSSWSSTLSILSTASSLSRHSFSTATCTPSSSVPFLGMNNLRRLELNLPAIGRPSSVSSW